MVQTPTLTRTRRIRRADHAKYVRRRIALVLASAGVTFATGCVAGLLAGWIFPYHRAAALALAHRQAVTRPVNVLVAGIDVDYDRQGHPLPALHARTDTLMLAHVDPVSHLVKVLSIPRDTQVLVPGYGTAKINSAHTLQGMPSTIRAVEALLDLHVDHWAEVDLPAAVKLVDELGPVRLYVPVRTRYTDHTAHLAIDFDAGWHQMDGQQLVAYARFRHDAMGDIGRVSRQQLIVHALAERLASPATWWHLPHLLATAARMVRTDMTPGDLAALAAVARDHYATRFVTLPGEFGYDGYWIPSAGKIADLVQGLDAQTLPAAHPRGQTGTVELLYQADQERAASQLATQMTDRGLQVIRTAPLAADQPAVTKVVERVEGGPGATTVHALLPRAPWQVSDELAAYTADYTVIVGPDFAP